MALVVRPVPDRIAPAVGGPAAAAPRGVCARVQECGARVLRGLKEMGIAAARYVGRILLVIVLGAAVIAGVALVVTALVAIGVYNAAHGRPPFAGLAERIRNLPAFQRAGNRLGVQIVRREQLDPAINRAHFTAQVREVPEAPAGVDLEDLCHFFPDIDLSQFVANIQNVCEGRAGAPVPGTPDYDQFRERSHRLAKHVIYALQHSDHPEVIKRSICENLEDSGRNCAPRHMEDLELAYESLVDGNLFTTREKVIRITQKLRTEIVERLTHQRGGSIHVRSGILRAIGEEFRIPGYNAQRDPFANQFEPLDIRQVFHALYTPEALIERLSQAVHVPVRLREIPKQELIDWFKNNVPLDFNPEIQNPDDRWRAYLTDEVYTEDMENIKPQALRHLLVAFDVLNA